MRDDAGSITETVSGYGSSVSVSVSVSGSVSGSGDLLIPSWAAFFRISDDNNFTHLS
jgi:hypothetical protein